MRSFGALAYLVYGTLVLVAVAHATAGVYQNSTLRWFTAYLIAINLVAFAFYGYDKLLVRPLNLLGLRVPEDVLIWGLAFPGGLLGAWLGMQVFAHKTGSGSQEFRARLRTASALSLIMFLTLFVLSGQGLISLLWVDAAIEALANLVINVSQGVVTALS